MLFTLLKVDTKIRKGGNIDITSILHALFIGILTELKVLVVTSGISNARYSTSGSSAKSLEKVTLDTDVSELNVGSGQFNGEFVVAEQQGIKLRLRIQEHFFGLLEVTGENGNRIGVYEAATGKTGDTEDNLATWNYDWHVDLSDARGKVLADYRLFLEQDFSEENLFGALDSDPVKLPLTPIIMFFGNF